MQIFTVRITRFKAILQNVQTLRNFVIACTRNYNFENHPLRKILEIIIYKYIYISFGPR